MKGHQVQDNRVLPPICLSGVEKCFLSGAVDPVELEQNRVTLALGGREATAWLPGETSYLFALETLSLQISGPHVRPST